MAVSTMKMNGWQYIDVTDSSPVNVRNATGGVVTTDNFVTAFAISNDVMCLPYRYGNLPYILLKDRNMSALSGEKSIRIYYR